jgi:hypothetical protein
MTIRILFCIQLMLFVSKGLAQVPSELILPFEIDPNKSLTYSELISYCNILDSRFAAFKLDSIGQTDSGHPLHFAIISNGIPKDRQEAIESGKAIVFINNAIHPGEPEGIDASMALIRDILLDPDKRSILDKLTIVLIPAYNVGGMLNRNSYSRANQNGPESYGFRGNARNLDLNRDFIKCDSRNARAFSKIFQVWLPHIFIDNHTSNGADYQHTMTLLNTLHDKLGGPMAAFMNDILLPGLYTQMKERQWPICPYVVSRGSPEHGIYGYNDSPRYSSGYATLFGSIGLLPETHMLKPFIDRLWSNYHLMEVALQQAAVHAGLLISLHESQVDEFLSKGIYETNWRIDTSRPDSILFAGYEAILENGKISGQQMLKYDRTKPWERYIPYFPNAFASLKIEVPDAYIIPQAWAEVIQRLEWNNIQYSKLDRDTLIEVESYTIQDFKTVNQPYEGHYLHYDIKVESNLTTRQFHKGDLMVSTHQPALRYILEALEPAAEDSFFAWNFFDSVLQGKEGYSAYVFDDLASELLDKDPVLKAKFNEKKQGDSAFDADGSAQLRYIYENSPFNQNNKNVYPVARYFNRK